MSDKLVVTRHKALVDHLFKKGLVEEGTPVVRHVVRPGEVQGKHVYGHLPFHLAVHAASITTIPLNVPADMRGVELTLEEIDRYAGTPTQFVVVSQRDFANISDRLHYAGAAAGIDDVWYYLKGKGA